MARQQKRAAKREAIKAKTRKAPAAKKSDTTLVVVTAAKKLKAEDLSDRQVAHVAKIESIEVNDQIFKPDRPDYNPRDTQMQTVHCCV